MNSSYDDVNEAQEVQIEPHVLPRTYERNSKKKRIKLRPNSMPQPNMEQYCSAETDDIKEDAYSKPLPKNTKSCGRFKKSIEQSRRVIAHEPVSTGILGERNNEGRASNGNVTSLVSFDPKSSTLLRVREHLDSEEDEIEGYSRIHKDSVPSMMAPSLPSTTNDFSVSDSGVLVSTVDWPTPPLRSDLSRKQLREQLYLPFKEGTKLKSMSPVSPGIKLSTEPLNSPGIKLLNDLEKSSEEHSSSFHVQNRDNIIVVGHYHATNEFTLMNETGEPANVPIISGNSLLV
uniref:Uncharacterized protein n=1 Tax=Heterorhabditis bacteriophora TaxID=37862 RepID=A0A1I7X992_HETBA